MAIILEAAYSKKLGLPNYSSHSYVVSIRTELSDLTQVEAESARLYALLQQSVDDEIQQVGFLPDATHYGMNTGELPPHHPPAAERSRVHRTATVHTASMPGRAPTSRRKLILKLVEQHGLDKQEVEALAKRDVQPARQDPEPPAGQRPHRGTPRTPRQGTASTARPCQRCRLPPEARPRMKETSHHRKVPTRTAAEIVTDLLRSVSASRLSLFQSCRLRFFFRYVLS